MYTVIQVPSYIRTEHKLLNELTDTNCFNSYFNVKIYLCYIFNLYSFCLVCHASRIPIQMQTIWTVIYTDYQTFLSSPIQIWHLQVYLIDFQLEDDTLLL